MSEDKVRVSGEKERDAQPEPVLPTINPAVVAQQEQKKSSIHPAFYIAYANPHLSRQQRTSC